MSSNRTPTPDAPGSSQLRLPWSRSQRPVARRLVRPLQSFLEAEAASAFLLVGAAAVAIVWANSQWRASYEDLWATDAGLRLGRFAIENDLRGWVNEGLMSLFFVVVALEVKRELLTGELRDRRAAFLPVIGAIGGMVLPALLYLAVTAGTAGAEGWGAVMPTDIAVAAAVLALAWPGSSPGVRVFLLSLALADDIGSVAVVALAYSGEVAWGWLGVAASVGVVIVALQRIHVRATVVYVALGVGMWLAVREAGVSPTLAGVALGFLTPAEPFQRPRAVSDEAHRVADATLDFPPTPDADAPEWLRLAGLSREAVSPLARVEAALHPWTSYVVVPVFALANAGVVVSPAALDGPVERRVALGVLLGRLVGKPLGIAFACALAIRLGAARPPPAGDLPLIGLGMAAAVPFTVSLFIAELALPGRLLDAAKLGIFASAIVAGVAGFLLLRSQRRSRARATTRSNAG